MYQHELYIANTVIRTLCSCHSIEHLWNIHDANQFGTISANCICVPNIYFSSLAYAFLLSLVYINTFFDLIDELTSYAVFYLHLDVQELTLVCIQNKMYIVYESQYWVKNL